MTLDIEAIPKNGLLSCVLKFIDKGFDLLTVEVEDG